MLGYGAAMTEKYSFMSPNIETRILNSLGVLCHICQKRIKLGQWYMSKRSTTNKRGCKSRYYHRKCWEDSFQ